MNNTTDRTKTLAIILGIFVILAGVYFLLFSKGAKSGAAVSASSSASGAEAQFLSLAGQLGSISFDTSIFSDPRFTSLVDMHTAILPEAIGRNDPFAALSGSSSGTTGQ